MRIEKRELTIKEILDRLELKEYYLDNKSSVIEALLLRVPLAPLYLRNNNTNNKWELFVEHPNIIIIKKFIDGIFTLKDLSYFPSLDESSYLELARNYTRRIEETEITCYIVGPKILEWEENILRDIWEN
jgi:hypothetical protein